MKKFEILRYLKRFSLLIFLVSLAGAAAIYMYADGRQKYTASVIIRYTNDGISDGYTPDGSELDVNEIYSSTVISQAMDALGASGRLSTIRSNISVTPVISEDQQTINEALLQKGEEVTYFPDTYKVSLVVDGEQGAGYARNMLDAIIQSYCTYYTEKYVEQKLSLNPSSGLLDNGYDYYECIRILENDTNEMQDYLLSKREHYPNFRSSRTGYTYADLCDIGRGGGLVVGGLAAAGTQCDERERQHEGEDERRDLFHGSFSFIFLFLEFVWFRMIGCAVYQRHIRPRRMFTRNSAG